MASQRMDQDSMSSREVIEGHQANVAVDRQDGSRRVGLFVLLLLLAGMPSLTEWAGMGGTGTDDQAMQMIEQLRPGYERWAEPLFEPSEGQERLLFLLQAFGGASVLLYLMWRYSKGRSGGPGQRIQASDGKKRAQHRPAKRGTE